MCIEGFEDTKGVITIRKSKKNRQHKVQIDKQRSTKHSIFFIKLLRMSDHCAIQYEQ
jgi:hypothetical protein